MHPSVPDGTRDVLLSGNAKKELTVGVPILKFAGCSVAAFALIAGLTGCVGESAPQPSETTPASESPTPSAEPSADPNADVLFTITANVRAVDGRTIGISMAAHAPVGSTEDAAADIRAQFLSVCSAGNGSQPMTEQYLDENGSTLMRISIDSTTPDLTFASPIGLFFGSPYFAQSASGGGITPVSAGQICFNGFDWATSGTVRGVADFENSDGVPDLNQWQFGRYGFSVDPNSGATIEACKVTMTEVGMKSDLTQVPGWDPTQAGDGISCMIGYAGE
jgi:hypothetical protein